MQKQLLLTAMVVAVVSIGLSLPAAAQSASRAAIIAKCREKYPETGTGLERRNAAAMRRQCIQSGGKN